jgi:DNA processing protein
MGWDMPEKIQPARQPELFVELSDNEKLIMDILREKPSIHIDELNLRSGLSNTTTAAAILNLELQNIIQALPGKMYQLVN